MSTGTGVQESAREQVEQLSFWERTRTTVESWKVTQFILRLYEREYRRAMTSSLKGVPLLLVIITVALTVFGMVMILSASSVEEISSTASASPWGQVYRQAMFAAGGFVAMGLVAIIPVRFYRRNFMMYGLLLVTWLLQLLVIAVGTTVNGNKNWIQLGSISIQPSEFSKLFMILWLAWVLTQQGNISKLHKALFPALGGFLVLIGLIYMGDDVGTITIYGIILLAMLVIAGIQRKHLLGMLGVVAVFGILAVVSSSNRMARVLGVFGNCDGSTCDQSNSGLAALATGGFWGVGLGRSRQKYNYLPEAHNDYIFAIVGEELGLLGTLLIILLYLGLTYCVVRIMLRSADRFITLASGGILTWIVGQALVNILMVAGVFPVIGVPLPFISYGGSSLVASMLAVGVLIAFARQTPQLAITDDYSGRFYLAYSNPKEKVRRGKLGRLVEAERAKIAAAGEDAGIDFFKPKEWPIVAGFMTVFGYNQPRTASQSRTSSQPRMSQSRTSQPRMSQRRVSGQPVTQRPRQIAAQKAPAPQAPAQNTSAQQPAVQKPTAQKPAVQKPAVQQTSAKPVASQPAKRQEEQKLPAGLKPMKQIRAQRRNDYKG